MRAERDVPRSEAVLASVAATIRDVVAELASRTPRDDGLLRRLQAMVDDVSAHWDGLVREAAQARREADDAIEDAHASIEAAEARLDDYVAKCEAQVRSDMAMVEEGHRAEVDALRAEAATALDAADQGRAALTADRDALAHAVETMAQAMREATDADGAEAGRAAPLLAAARGQRAEALA